jgi:urate oxidase
MKYRIKIIETLSKVVEVEADDYDSAFEKVEEMANSKILFLKTLPMDKFL